MNINQNFRALCKYEKFKKDYQYVVENEHRLIRRIADYKQYKANKAKKIKKSKKRASSKIITTASIKRASAVMAAQKKKKKNKEHFSSSSSSSCYSFPQLHSDAAIRHNDIICDVYEPPNSPSYNDGSSAASTVSIDVFETTK